MKIDQNELIWELHEADERIYQDLLSAAMSKNSRRVCYLEGVLSGISKARQIIKNLAQRELLRGEKEKKK